MGKQHLEVTVTDVISIWLKLGHPASYFTTKSAPRCILQWVLSYQSPSDVNAVAPWPFGSPGLHPTPRAEPHREHWCKALSFSVRQELGFTQLQGAAASV